MDFLNNSLKTDGSLEELITGAGNYFVRQIEAEIGGSGLTDEEIWAAIWEKEEGSLYDRNWRKNITERLENWKVVVEEKDHHVKKTLEGVRELLEKKKKNFISFIILSN